jgi:hypothetical protein
MATTKTLAAVTTVTTVTTSQYIPLTDGSGNTTKVSLANLKTALLAGINLTASTTEYLLCSTEQR